MRLNKFSKVNTASFKDFSWPASLVNFNDVNIVLGWNGSGKTVLSRILRSFEKEEILNLPASSEFTLKIDGINYNQASLGSFGAQIRVFNEDYVAKVMTEGSLPYVIYVGEEPVDYSKKEGELEKLKKQEGEITCVDKYSQIAEEVAKKIRLLTGIGNVKKELEPGYFNAYYRQSFEKRINDFSKKVEGGEDLKPYILNEEQTKGLQDQLANQEAKQREFETVKRWNDWLVDNTKSINDVFSSIPLHEKSERIAKFKDKEQAYDWIRKGVEVHELSDEKKKHTVCLFCNSSIRNAEELLKHFTDDIIKINNQIDGFLAEITRADAELNKITSFYTKDASALKKVFVSIKVDLIKKKKGPTEKLKEISFSDLFTGKEAGLQPLQDVAHQLEKSFVAESYEKYMLAKAEYDSCLQRKQGLQQQISGEKKQLSQLKAKAKNVRAPADKLNELLKVTFPYKQIELEDADDETGYEIHRSGEPCNFSTLSEGERNFIALAYFLVAINTTDEEKKLADDGIVVIDDPVSSLDKNSIFQIFAIIANEVERNDKRQYLFLTHNLDFYSHLCHHFKDETALFYQISFDESGSKIEKIHELLRNFKSDYQYSISLLWNKKQSTTIEDAYHMVNLLRRVWETFLYFKFGPGDFRSKLEQAYNYAFKEIKVKMQGAKKEVVEKKEEEFKTNFLAMYRFVNYGSHEFSSIETFDISILKDAHRRISDFFDVLKLLDKHHFDNVTQ